jgi:hypothetical protein
MHKVRHIAMLHFIQFITHIEPCLAFESTVVFRVDFLMSDLHPLRSLT